MIQLIDWLILLSITIQLYNIFIFLREKKTNREGFVIFFLKKDFTVLRFSVVFYLLCFGFFLEISGIVFGDNFLHYNRELFDILEWINFLWLFLVFSFWQNNDAKPEGQMAIYFCGKDPRSSNQL